jgi:hypothetical protein
MKKREERDVSGLFHSVTYPNKTGDLYMPRKCARPGISGGSLKLSNDKPTQVSNGGTSAFERADRLQNKSVPAVSFTKLRQ